MSENQKGVVTGLGLVSDWMIYTHWEADESFAFPNKDNKIACILVAGERNLFICNINADGTPGTDRRALTYNTDEEEVPKFEELLAGEYVIWAILAPLTDKNWNLSRECAGCAIPNIPCIDCYCRRFRADNQFKKDTFLAIKGLRAYARHSKQALSGRQTSVETAHEVFPLPEAHQLPRDEYGALDISKVVPPTDWMKLLSYEMFKFEVSFSKKFRTLQELVINQIIAQNDKMRETVSALNIDRQIEAIRRRNGNNNGK